MKKFFKEFKAFITRGNIFDMAVGLIIATAFNKIVSSLVNDIIMPLITWGTGAASLADLSVVLRRDAEGVATLTWAYGNFIQTIIDFLIIAFSIFIAIRTINKLNDRAKQDLDKMSKKSKFFKGKKKKEEPIPEPTTKVCPYCLSEINIKATRCPHCTSELKLEEKTKKTTKAKKEIKKA